MRRALYIDKTFVAMVPETVDPGPLPSGVALYKCEEGPREVRIDPSRQRLTTRTVEDHRRKVRRVEHVAVDDEEGVLLQTVQTFGGQPLLSVLLDLYNEIGGTVGRPAMDYDAFVAMLHQRLYGPR